MDVIFETIREFSQRVNLPEQLIRCLVKQGKLPHIKPKSCWVKINVKSALLALDAARRNERNNSRRVSGKNASTYQDHAQAGEETPGTVAGQNPTSEKSREGGSETVQCQDCNGAVTDVIRLRALVKQIVRNVTDEHVAILKDNCEPSDVLIVKEILAKARKEVGL